jgi:hypothetical protein
MKFSIKAVIFPIAFSISFLFLSGCILNQHKVFTHSPPLAEKARKIQKGKTTRIQLETMLGVPDVLAEGSHTTLFPNSVMGLMRQEKRNHCYKIKERGAKISSEVTFDPDWYRKFAELEPYSSIDDNHIAFLYLEYEMTLKGGWIGFPVGISKINVRINKNRLLVFVNKTTGLVDEFAYGEEFKVE